jgi:hypothetical protein
MVPKNANHDALEQRAHLPKPERSLGALNPRSVACGSCVMRTGWTPSIVPAGNDQTVYLAKDDLGSNGAVWREAAAETTDLETVDEIADCSRPAWPRKDCPARLIFCRVRRVLLIDILEADTSARTIRRPPAKKAVDHVLDLSLSHRLLIHGRVVRADAATLVLLTHTRSSSC